MVLLFGAHGEDLVEGLGAFRWLLFHVDRLGLIFPDSHGIFIRRSDFLNVVRPCVARFPERVLHVLLEMVVERLQHGPVL